ncbi:glycosyltransferase family 2 protein [Cohnella candidum]|uniref:glycosyltransferase family 2 protein n=1 Tax=Cohnella candidum TaxID=2674991 RepID=UPI0030B99E02
MTLKYIIGTGYVNRPDLLYRAVHSVKPCWKHAVIIDNSESEFFRREPFFSERLTVYEPPVPLRYPQMMNLMQKWGKEKGCDVILFFHSDAEVHPGTVEQFLSELETMKAEGRKWGVAFTNYDVLVAYNMEAVREVGQWDTVFYDYHADIDYYRRLQLAGYEIVYTSLGVTHCNGGSNTSKSDTYRRYLFENVTFAYFHTYYQIKWGGPIGGEVYTLPFNRFPLNPDHIR